MSYLDVRKSLMLAGVGLLCLCDIAWSADTASTAPKSQAMGKATGAPLDIPAVRKLYLDGDFEAAIARIETSLKYETDFSHQDSVFCFKHLGVMYAANNETREKGKLYMHKLLEVEPTARIMDMYASDMIYMIFKNIQDEYNSMNYGEDPNNWPRSTQEENDLPRQKRLAWVGWTTGALAAAGGIALGIYMLKSDETASVRKENLIRE